MIIPSSTYRVQLHAGFTFRHLEVILDYLHELGISTVYASPITTALKGSQHGYDVTNALAINPEIGTEEDLERMTGVLKKYDMSWLQDIVPNHMAFDHHNTWLYDTLERGKNSEYYFFFDIDTDHSGELTGTRIMAPFLGKPLTECLQQKELQLEYTGNGFVIRYYDKEYPVSIPSYLWICTITEGCPPDLITSLGNLEQSALQSAREWVTIKKNWLEQVARTKEWASFLRQRIAFFNEQETLLTELLNNQHYILTHGRLAASRINYRRFFTVNELICLRMEDPMVFTAYHSTIREWVKKGYVQGLRVDHIDGLAYPRRYLGDLKRLMGNDCYIVAEKILAADEALPENWQLEGTTGYEFMSVLNQLLTDENGYRELQAFYREQTGDTMAYEDIVFAKKYDFLKKQMGGEWNNLMDMLLALPLLEADKMNRERLKEALGMLMASFPVYRVYPDENPLAEDSREIVRNACANVRQRMLHAGSIDPSTHELPEVDFLEQLFEESGDTEKNKQQKVIQTRLMQFTGPLAAKGIEDTTFYVYDPLISRNEVGDNPGIIGMEPAEFHNKMQERQASFPYSLNTTTTHDTKRGEDARIRITWLTSCPSEWMKRVINWKRLNRSYIQGVQDNPTPSANDEYLIYQSLLGSFPTDLLVSDAYRERYHQYLTKALREAKTNTNYDSPDEAYENGCHDFLTTILKEGSAFLEDFIPFVHKVIRGSAAYSLSQELVKLTAPGIPDIYQGSECGDTSLVDPDNRRPVDYTIRKQLLQKIKEEGRPPKGTEKLFLVYKTLAYRKENPLVFTSGEYIPVTVVSPFLAYIRRYKEDWVLVILPLIRKDIPVPGTFSITLPEGAPSAWVNVFTEESVTSSGEEGDVLVLQEGLSKFPVALFIGKSL